MSASLGSAKCVYTFTSDGGSTACLEIERHADELAMIETLDNGMPCWLSKAIATAASDIFRYYAGWCSKIFGTTIPADQG